MMVHSPRPATSRPDMIPREDIQSWSEKHVHQAQQVTEEADGAHSVIEAPKLSVSPHPPNL
jgi:hypothetical protein